MAAISTPVHNVAQAPARTLSAVRVKREEASLKGFFSRHEDPAIHPPQNAGHSGEQKKSRPDHAEPVAKNT